MLFEVLRGTDAGEEEEFGGVDGAGGEDDFLFCCVWDCVSDCDESNLAGGRSHFLPEAVSTATAVCPSNKIFVTAASVVIVRLEGGDDRNASEAVMRRP